MTKKRIANILRRILIFYEIKMKKGLVYVSMVAILSYNMLPMTLAMEENAVTNLILSESEGGG